jgi:outer membrane protein assembly factor BamA
LLTVFALSTAPRALAFDPEMPPEMQGGGDVAKAKDDKKGARKEGEVGGAPAIFRTPETGLAVGAVFIYLPPRAKTKVSSALAGLLYTQKNQILLALYSERYFGDDKWALEAYGQYQDYPDSFFGIGNDTLVGDKEQFIWRERKGALGLRRLLTPDLRIGLNTSAQTDDFADIEDDGMLASGDVRGAAGGDLHALGGSIRYDTFDDGYGPTKGDVVNFVGLHYSGDYTYDSYELNLKKFWPVDAESEIGAHIYGLMLTGEPPFYQLGALGGKNLLRGYYLGRYRDRNMLVAQSEYRHRLWCRFGGVLFAGAGEVAREPDDFTAKDLKPSGGFGGRYQLVEGQRINLRLDVAFGRGEQNPSIYFYILEAF